MDNAARTSHDLNGSNGRGHESVADGTANGTPRERAESESALNEQPLFGPTAHKKGSDSIISDNGTHYIGYGDVQEQQSEMAMNHGAAKGVAMGQQENTALLDVEQQRIHQIIDTLPTALSSPK